MRIFVAGATGALGRPVVRRLTEVGHEVTGMTRSPEKRRLLEGLGARPVVADALNAAAAQRAVGEARPDAVLNLLTALPSAGPTRARQLRATNEVLQRGTANLIRGARAGGARRMVAESFIGIYGFGTGEVVTEGAPLPRPDPNTGVGAGRAAMRSLEGQVLGAEGIEGIVLRYGAFYGPGVGTTEAWVERLRRRKLPLPGGGPGIVSWIHIEDAAAATVAALERGRPGEVYNVVDDQPAALGEVVGSLAAAIGAPPPRSIPVWVARLLAPYAAAYTTRTNLRVSNEKAKRELEWAPVFPTYREGLKQVAAAYRP